LLKTSSIKHGRDLPAALRRWHGSHAVEKADTPPTSAYPTVFLHSTSWQPFNAS
jgi:hypothetical protein